MHKNIFWKNNDDDNDHYIHWDFFIIIFFQKTKKNISKMRNII
jgi:hypothetical protein